MTLSMTGAEGNLWGEEGGGGSLRLVQRGAREGKEGRGEGGKRR